MSGGSSILYKRKYKKTSSKEHLGGGGAAKAFIATGEGEKNRTGMHPQGNRRCGRSERQGKKHLRGVID